MKKVKIIALGLKDKKKQHMEEGKEYSVSQAVADILIKSKKAKLAEVKK